MERPESQAGKPEGGHDARGRTGTWGDWSKEQTILPNNIALNVWDGAAANIAPRSITAIEEPAALGVFFPVSGPVAGVATWTTNLADTQVDIDPWGSACVPDFNNPSVGGGWTPTYAQFKAHNNSSPVSFADGHSGKVKQNGWYQDPACGGVPLSWAKQRYPNRLWGYYLQGHEPVN